MSARQDPENSSMLGVGADGEQYLTFLLASEEYGVDILRVQEIRGWDTVTTLPNSPVYLKGVSNLRGTIVPLVDLRQRFGLEPLPYGPTTVVIVLKVLGEQRERIMGLIVDAVSDVYAMRLEQMRPLPDSGAAIRTECVKGLAIVDEKTVIVLDIDRLLNTGELFVVDDMAASQGAPHQGAERRVSVGTEAVNTPERG
jgi:purine-binding chemotaxis protein CheW